MGGEGSKIGQHCLRIVLKKLPTWGRGCQKSGKLPTLLMDGPIHIWFVYRCTGMYTWLQKEFDPISQNITLIFCRYSIGNSDLINGLEYGWLYSLARITKQPYTQLVLFKEDNRTITKIELRVSETLSCTQSKIIACTCRFLPYSLMGT